MVMNPSQSKKVCVFFWYMSQTPRIISCAKAGTPFPSKNSTSLLRICPKSNLMRELVLLSLFPSFFSLNRGAVFRVSELISIATFAYSHYKSYTIRIASSMLATLVLVFNTLFQYFYEYINIHNTLL